MGIKLKTLNKLASKKIAQTPNLTAAECSRIVNMSIQTFSYKIKTGNLSWEQIARLRLDLDREDVIQAIEKDLKIKLRD